LSNVTVTDPRCDAAPVLGTKAGGDTDDALDPGETWTYTCSHVVQTGDGAQVANTATATGTDVLGTKVTSQDSRTVGVLHPGIAIDKTHVEPATGIHPGDTVVFNYTVTNTGDTALANVSVTDDKCSPVTQTGGDTNKNGLLDTTESWTYTCSAVVR